MFALFNKAGKPSTRSHCCAGLFVSRVQPLLFTAPLLSPQKSKKTDWESGDGKKLKKPCL